MNYELRGSSVEETTLKPPSKSDSVKKARRKGLHQIALISGRKIKGENYVKRY